MTGTGQKYQNSRGWIFGGFIVILTLFGGFGAWAVFSDIEGAVIAQGVVAVESKTKTVQHLTGGVVGEIHVSNGDRVKAGDLLVSLDETLIRANLAVTTGELFEFEARRARLEAERDRIDAVSFPKSMTKLGDREKARKVLNGQKSLFEARRVSRTGQAELLKQKIDQLKQQITGLEAQRNAKKRQSELIKQEIASIEPLFKNGLIPFKRVLELKRESARIDGEFGKHVSDIAQTGSAIGETRMKILQIGTDFREQVLTELRQVQLKISELRERKVAFEDKLRHTKIRAPRAGRIHDLAIHTIGGVISPAAPILQVVPEEDQLVVEARVQTSDIEQIAIGQPAVLRFSAFNMRQTPELDGQVRKISADRFIDEKSGAPYFTVTLELAKDQLARLGSQKLISGMPAEVFMRTSPRTVMSYFLKPLTDQMMRAFREG